MTRLLDILYPGDGVTWLVANVLVQVTAAICVTKLVSHQLLRPSPPVRHAEWLACLAFAAFCPLFTSLADWSGFSFVWLPVSEQDRTASGASAAASARFDAAVGLSTIDSANHPPVLTARHPSEERSFDPAQPTSGTTAPRANSHEFFRKVGPPILLGLMLRLVLLTLR